MADAITRPDGFYWIHFKAMDAEEMLYAGDNTKRYWTIGHFATFGDHGHWYVFGDDEPVAEADLIVGERIGEPFPPEAFQKVVKNDRQ